MPSKREILIANRHPRLRFDRRAVARVIHVLDREFRSAPIARARPSGKSKIEIRISKFPQGELSLVFLTDAALAKLHADFLSDPTPTDVITFEGDPSAGTAGEICVSVDAALQHAAGASPRRSPSVLPLSAARSRPSTPDFSTELTLYLVHGWLHLAGFDDLKPAKKRQMRRAEAKAMKLLRSAKVIPSFSLRR